MSEDAASYRRILKSTSIVGGATIGSIAIGMVRMKVFALLLGPLGVGLFGVLTAVFSTGTAIAGLGLGASGVRQIAADLADAPRIARARLALWTISLPLALAAVLIVGIFRAPIARLSAGTDAQASAIGWVGVAIGLSVLTAVQQIELQAFQRTADLARVRLIGTAITAVAGIGAVILFGTPGIVIAIIAVPIGQWLVGVRLNRDLPPLPLRGLRGRGLRAEWRALLGLGVALTISGAVGGVAQIGMRAVVARRLGLDATGLFQAAWAISATNLGIVLTAMAADYYPRLCAISSDRRATDALVNQQLRIALVVGGPLLLAMSTLGPLVLRILYSGKFAGALPMLRLQLVGDVLKLASFSLGYALLARGRGLRYVIAEASFSAVALPGSLLLTPLLGLEGSGFAYVAALACVVPLTLLLARVQDRLTIARINLRQMTALLAALTAVWALARWSEPAAEILGALFTVAFGIYAARALHQMHIVLPGARFVARVWRGSAHAG